MKRVIFPLIVLLALSSCAVNAEVSNDAAIAAIDNVIMTRRSIRKYTDQDISRETLMAIANAGINAPNGQNRQAYEVRIAERPFVAEGDRYKNLFKGAPYVFFIAADKSYDMSQVDCGLLGENIILAAWARGIGSCCLAQPIRTLKNSPECADFLKKLDFSEGYELLYCIALGYPDEEPAAKARKSEKVRFIE